MRTAALSIDASRIRLDGHGFTPGAFAGGSITYTAYDGSRKFSGDLATLDGLIQPTFEVDDSGNVRISMGRNGLVGSAIPGRLVAVLATTAGEVVHANAEVTA